jgi:hypothetical protein
VGVQIDHPRQQHPWPDVERAYYEVSVFAGRAREGDAAACIDRQQPVALEPRTAAAEWRQQSTAQDERGCGGQVHARQATGDDVATGYETTRIGRSGSGRS